MKDTDTLVGGKPRFDAQTFMQEFQSLRLIRSHQFVDVFPEMLQSCLMRQTVDAVFSGPRAPQGNAAVFRRFLRLLRGGLAAFEFIRNFRYPFRCRETRFKGFDFRLDLLGAAVAL